MKSLLTISGTFLFTLFCDFFIRVVIIFYHQSEIKFYGVSSLPGFQWILLLLVGVGIATWIASMLLVTIINHSPEKYLLALSALFLLWRISEFFAIQEEALMYTITIILVQGVAIWLALITKRKINASISTS